MPRRPLALRAALAAAFAALCAAPAAAQRTGVPPTQAPTGVPVTRPAPGQRITRPAQAGARADTLPRDTSARHRNVAPPDSLYNALLKLPGYTPVEYQADSAQFDNSTRTLHLRGGAQVVREGTTLDAADSIVYRERSRFMEAYGKPKVTGQGEDIAGNVMFYDLTTRRASVRGARTKVAENGVWYVEGNVTSEAAERVYATSSTFTSDDRPEPAYHFKADKVMVVRDRLLVGRPAVLYFRNVPVMALPFIVQPLEKGRRSGLLNPVFDVNDIVRTSPRRTERGTGRELSNLGYYWAVSPYLGVQMAGAWRSGAYRSLAGGADFRVLRSFLDGGVTFENYWRTDAQARNFNLAGHTSWKPSERTDLSIQANYASSSAFERQRTIDPTRATATLRSSGSLARRFDWGSVNLSSELSQSLADDSKQATFPTFSVSVNPITLFRSTDPEHTGFFNDATLNLGLNGSRRTQTPGNGLATRQPATTSTSLDAAPSLTLHSLTLGTSFNYSRDETGGLDAIDSAKAAQGVASSRLAAIRAFSRQQASWSASTSYQFRLIGTTTFSPNLSLSQNLTAIDDTVSFPERLAPTPRGAFGHWVASPPRLNFGANVSADLFGFFPGFGPYSAIRHHLKPGLQYGYTPGFAPSAIQRAVFGSAATATQNRLTLSLDQTFEGKLKQVRQPVARRDTTGADSAAAPVAEAPSDARKVTILAINTSALTYDFNPVPLSPQDLYNPHFSTPDITNTIRSDLLGGLNMQIGHNLFRRVLDDSGRVVKRHFSPYLTSFSTSFTLGQNSAIFRFLGLAHAPNTDNRGDQPARPDTTSQRLQNPQGANSAIGNTQPAGGGPWSANVRYSLQRSRPDVDTLGRVTFSDNQDVTGGIQFYPTKNWGVSWNTSYSVTSHTFGQHALTFTRNLYRWQADFQFYRTPTGNTAFSFRVHLIDLPDLKFDYRESNLGFDRPQTLTTR